MSIVGVGISLNTILNIEQVNILQNQIAAKATKKELAMSDENKITIEQFLFGGVFWEYGDPARTTVLEGFHCVTKPEEFPEKFANFTVFKETVCHLLDQYGWDEENMVTVDISEATQTFDIINIPESELYNTYKDLTESLYFSQELQSCKEVKRKKL